MPDTFESSKHPTVKDPAMVGTYPALVKAGGGYIWDEVLEYRVWCHPEEGAPDLEDGNDYFYFFKHTKKRLHTITKILVQSRHWRLFCKKNTSMNRNPASFCM